MKTKLTRQQMLAVGLASLGLLLGLGSYMILVAPQKSKAVALAGAVDAAQSSLFVAQHHPQVTTRAKPPAVEAADLFRLTKAMPDSEDVPGILLSLMGLAQANSLKLVSVQPTTGTATPAGYTTVPISVTLDGKFDDVAAFLQQLRDSVVVTHRDQLKVTNRLFVPTDISLTTDPDGSTVDATISLDAFVYGTAPPPVSTSTTDTSTTSTTTTTTTTSSS